MMLVAGGVCAFALASCAPPQTIVEYIDFRVIPDVQGNWFGCIPAADNDEGKDISITFGVEGPLAGRVVTIHDAKTFIDCDGLPMMTIVHTLSLTQGNEGDTLPDTSIAADFFYNTVEVTANHADYLATVQSMSENGSAIVDEYYPVTNFDEWFVIHLPEPDEMTYASIAIDETADPVEMLVAFPSLDLDESESGEDEDTRVVTLADTVFYFIPE